MTKNRFKVFVLFVLITTIVVYISIPLYGVIRDSTNEGEVVFVLNSPLPDPGKAKAGNGVIAKIHRLLFPANEAAVSVGKRIDIKGRIIYSDQTPYANGLIELRSEPRYSRTDDNGYFIFTDVEEGTHSISVLDEEGNTLVTSSIYIERDAQMKHVELVHLPDNTLVFRVAINIALLELTMTLSHDDLHRSFILEKVELGFANSGAGSLQPKEETEASVPSVETPEPSITPEPTVTPGEPAKPSATPKEPAKPTAAIPESSKPPDQTPASSAAPTPPPPPVSNRFNLGVTDTADGVQYGSEGAVNVNIFGTKKRIAPGMKGSYAFTVDNRNSDYPARYDITFTPVDTLPSAYKIPIVYRLRKDEVYVAGGKDIWRTPIELHQNAVLDRGKYAKYTLDWYWPESEQDNDYAQFGGDPHYSYSLVIKVAASSQ